METLTTSKPKIAFTGVGWIGRNRMQAACNSGLADIVYISDPAEECIQEAQKLYAGCKAADRFEDIIQNPDVDAVVIATPSALHMQQCVQAFEQGKAVFCQKPLGRNFEEVQKVVRAAKQADRLLGADFSYRYTQAFRAMMEVIRSGALGNIFAADLKFHNAYGPDKPWFYDIRQSGGGCVLDLGIHLVDLLLLAFDFPAVQKVRSALYSKGTPVKGMNEVEDYADVHLELDNDVSVKLSCSWNLHAGRDAVIEVAFYGTKGAVVLNNVNGSFYDFVAQHFTGTQSHVLAEPPDIWGGRAIVHWLNTLAASRNYKSEAEQFLHSAEVLDRIYGRL